ncbi:hypothetical protein D3C85_1711430 [compost metagenome]
MIHQHPQDFQLSDQPENPTVRNFSAGLLLEQLPEVLDGRHYCIQRGVPVFDAPKNFLRQLGEDRI